jgi:peptidoglycan-associated lipoprotein
MKIQSIVIPAVLALLAVACSHESKPPQDPTHANDSVSITNATPKPGAPNAISLSEGLRKVCGIEDTGAAPKFEFDSAVLSSTDRSGLDQLARCMTSGPLAGKSVSLVGRADPRGEAEYNMNLGATRATAVKHYLAALGVTGSRLDATSRGSLDAQGHDEATWAIDRRVDLDLASR